MSYYDPYAIPPYNYGWGLNELLKDYELGLYTWLPPFKFIAPIEIGTFAFLFFGSVFMYIWANAKLPGTKTAWLFVSLTGAMVFQVISGVTLVVYVYVVRDDRLTKGSTFSEVMATYWLIIYVSGICFPAKCCSKDYFYQGGIVLFSVVGLVVSSVGIWAEDVRIMFRIGSCFLLAAVSGVLSLSIVTYVSFVKTYGSRLFAVMAVAAVFLLLNPVYYIYLVFKYKVYVFQAHYGFYVGLCWGPKLLVVILCQVYLIRLKYVDKEKEVSFEGKETEDRFEGKETESPFH